VVFRKVRTAQNPLFSRRIASGRQKVPTTSELVTS